MKSIKVASGGSTLRVKWIRFSFIKISAPSFIKSKKIAVYLLLNPLEVISKLSRCNLQKGSDLEN